MISTVIATSPTSSLGIVVVTLGKLASPSATVNVPA
jgi:hypothetical protein